MNKTRLPDIVERRSNERGQEARGRLVDAALTVFADKEYEGASTREIANAGGAGQAAILYHFNGKLGLYRAAAEAVVGRMQAPIAQAVSRAASAAADPALGPEAAREAVLLLLDAFAASLTRAGESERLSRFLLHEMLSPTEAFEQIFGEVMQPTHHCLSALIAKAVEEAEPSEDTRVRAFALLGQVIAFRVANLAAMRAIGWTQVGARESDLLRRVVRENTDAVLRCLKPG